MVLKSLFTGQQKNPKELLQILGLKLTLIADGSTPINHFNIAFSLQGLGSEAQPPAKKAAWGPSAQEGLLPIYTTAPLTLGNIQFVL